MSAAAPGPEPAGRARWWFDRGNSNRVHLVTLVSGSDVEWFEVNWGGWLGRVAPWNLFESRADAVTAALAYIREQRGRLDEAYAALLSMPRDVEAALADAADQTGREGQGSDGRADQHRRG